MGSEALIGQRKSYDCGPKSLLNACTVAGIDLDEETVDIACAAHPIHGCDEGKLLRACDILEIQAEGRETVDPDEAYEWLSGCMVLGFPVILCVEDFEHWVTAVGMLGNSILIADPWKNKVSSYSREEVLNWWCHSTETPPYYGIIIRDI